MPVVIVGMTNVLYMYFLPETGYLNGRCHGSGFSVRRYQVPAGEYVGHEYANRSCRALLC